jgi:hypothetical protein
MGFIIMSISIISRFLMATISTIIWCGTLVFSNTSTAAAAADPVMLPLEVVYIHEGGDPDIKDPFLTIFYDGKEVETNIPLGQMEAATPQSKLSLTTSRFHVKSNEKKPENVSLTLTAEYPEWKKYGSQTATMRVAANFVDHGGSSEDGGAELTSYLALGSEDAMTPNNGFQLSFESTKLLQEYADGEYHGRYTLLVTPVG